MAVCISGMKFWDVAVSFIKRLQVKESFLVSIFLRNGGVIANDHSQAPLLLEIMRSPFGSVYARSSFGCVYVRSSFLWVYTSIVKFWKASVHFQR